MGEEDQVIQIPEAHAEAPWIPEGGFTSNDQVFETINELHGKANAPIEVPEEYKEKGWAQNFKVESASDLFKNIDELQELKGKKTVPFDYSKASENEIEEHLSSRRVESIDDFDWGEKTEEGKLKNFKEEDKEFFGNMLKDMGVPKVLGDKMIVKSVERQNELKSKMYDKDGFKEILKESFQDSENGWDKRAAEVANSIKSNLSEEDQKLLDFIPNHILGVMYRLHGKTLKAYGAKEGDLRDIEDGGSKGGDIHAKQTELRIKIGEAKAKGEYETVKKLDNQLKETYKRDPRLKK